MILLLETVHPDALGVLESIGEPVILSESLSPGSDLAADNIRAIITRGLGTIDADVFSQFRQLEVVARCGAGLDNIDTDAAAAAQVPVVHAPGSTTHAVVEHALMLMLTVARRLVHLDSSVKAGNWGVREGYLGTEMRGKRLGVIGMGAIGTGIADLGRALGMDVVCTTRREPTSDVPRLSLAELLQTSEVVQLCVPLTEETRGFIGEAELASMKAGSLIINTARGQLVDHGALRNALDRGPLGGYGADVWDPEPPGQGDMTYPGLVITPHIAALTDVTYREICVRTVEAVKAVLDGADPEPSCVFRKTGVS